MAKSDARVKELEEALRVERQERAEADERAERAKDRARDTEEAYRKVQLDLATARDEASGARAEAERHKERADELEQQLAALRAEREADKADKPEKPETPETPESRESLPPETVVEPRPEATPSRPPAEVDEKLHAMLARVAELRELLATASIELSDLHADEVALAGKRTRVLTDACALLARAVGETGQAPPPVPRTSLEARLSVAPSVDISEVAELIESLRPPAPPKIEG